LSPLVAAATIHGQGGGAAYLVALGAVPGAWLRFRMVNHFEPMLPRRHWGTLTVNLLACFMLGLLVSLEASCGEGSRRLLLLLGTGFLGSFSTFSSFIGELHAVLRQRQLAEALLLVGSSVIGGLLAMALGLSLGGAP
jgi:CrcB protein